MKIPETYRWLDGVGTLPRMLTVGLQHLGVTETVGTQHNPTIMGWAKELDLRDYTADEIPWCGLFMAIVARRADYEVVRSPLWARSWASFGVPADQPSLGDVVVFSRPGGGGHVGLYVAHDDRGIHTLGGNQGNAVSIVPIAKGRLIAARRPRFRIGQPASVRPYRVARTGVLSTNEA